MAGQLRLKVLDTDRKEYDRVYGADDTYWMLANNQKRLKWESNDSPEVAQMKEFIDERESLGYRELMEKRTKLMEEAKKKLGIK